MFFFKAFSLSYSSTCHAVRVTVIRVLLLCFHCVILYANHSCTWYRLSVIKVDQIQPHAAAIELIEWPLYLWTTRREGNSIRRWAMTVCISCTRVHVQYYRKYVSKRVIKMALYCIWKRWYNNHDWWKFYPLMLFTVSLSIGFVIVTKPKLKHRKYKFKQKSLIFFFILP